MVGWYHLIPLRNFLRRNLRNFPKAPFRVLEGEAKFSTEGKRKETLEEHGYMILKTIPVTTKLLGTWMDF